MRHYETEVLWLKKLVSGYFVSEKQIKFYPPSRDSYYSLMVTKRPEGAAPRTPRTRAGLCGRCGGLIADHGDDLGPKCSNCGRIAGPPPPPTPEEIRAGILADLTAQAEGLLSPEDFAKTFVSLADLGRICGVSKKSFREWLLYHGWKFQKRRSPANGRWAQYVTVEQAKSVIEARR